MFQWNCPHSLIFYTAGYAVANDIPGHVPYAEKNGLWNRLGLIAKDKLDEFWRPHLEGKASFDEAATGILQTLAE